MVALLRALGGAAAGGRHVLVTWGSWGLMMDLAPLRLLSRDSTRTISLASLGNRNQRLARVKSSKTWVSSGTVNGF